MAKVLFLFRTAAIGVALFRQSSQASDTVRWTRSGEGCDSYYLDGKFFEVIRRDGIEVRVALGDTGWKMKATVTVVNGGGSRIDVLPHTFKLEMTKPTAKSLKYESPDALARSIRRDAAWRSIDPAMRTDATKTVTSTSGESGRVTITGPGNSQSSGTYSGQSTSTSVVPDDEAREKAKKELAEIARTAQGNVDRIQGMTMKANSLESGREITGAVFFQRDKKIQVAVLSILIGEVEFKFEFRFTKH